MRQQRDLSSDLLCLLRGGYAGIEPAIEIWTIY